MPQSLSRIILHIVFSTKNREPFLHDEIGKRMRAYLATVCRDCDAEAYRVGGVADHVHIACKLPRTITVSKLLETTKKESSKWIKKQGDGYKDFYWQGGYGAFSVSPSHLDPLIAQNPGDMNQPFRLNYPDSKTQGAALGFYENAPSVRKRLQAG
ncbi:MAG: putative transposase [Verrucomicrobiales bacterium]|jgi:putative transposase